MKLPHMLPGQLGPETASGSSYVRWPTQASFRNNTTVAALHQRTTVAVLHSRPTKAVLKGAQ